MSVVIFDGVSYKNTYERNSNLYHNEEWYINKLSKERKNLTKFGILFGLFFGVIVYLLIRTWFPMAWVFVVAIPILLVYFANKLSIRKMNLFEECTEEHYNFISNLYENEKDEIIVPYCNRYLSHENSEQNLKELNSYLNYKKEMVLRIEDAKLLIELHKKELVIRSIQSRIKPLKSKTPRNIAEALIDLYIEKGINVKEKIQDTLGDFELFQQEIEYYCDIETVEQEIIKLIDEYKILEFEQKLKRSRNTVLSINEVESMNGFEFEDFLVDLFKRAGFMVHQTKKTGDQGADLILEKNGVKTAIQAKRYSGKVGNKAVQEVVAASNFYECNKAMVVTTGDFTNSAIELAKKNNVILKGKKELVDLIELYY